MKEGVRRGQGRIEVQGPDPTCALETVVLGCRRGKWDAKCSGEMS